MSFPYPERKSPRLKDFDYSQAGAYFVTICTFQRVHRFGTVLDGRMQLSALGELVDSELANLPTYWDSVVLDSFVIMPNHLHAIIVLGELRPESSAPVPNSDAQKRVPTLGRVVGNFKGGVTRLARERGLLDDGSCQLWQGRYHDHIIRSESALVQIQAYIAENPLRWVQDSLFTPL